MTEDRLKAIEERVEKATPDWRLVPYDDPQFVFSHDNMVLEGRGFGANLPIADNLRFAAHARTDIPDLLLEVRSQAKRIEELEKALGKIMHESPTGSRESEIAMTVLNDPHPVESVEEKP